MALPGYLAPNISRNVGIAHGIRLYFRRDGETAWVDLGDITDPALTPVTEFLEYFSNHDGRNALATRILQNRGLTMNVTVTEINLENLRFALYGGSISSGSINVIAQTTPTVTAGNTLVLPESATSVISVKSENGETTYAVTSSYTHTPGSATITIVASGALDAATIAGDKVHVVYQVAFPGSSTRKFTLLDSTSVNGSVQFQIRNQGGGLAQIVELDDVQIAPNGDIGIAVDAVQSLPLTLTAQIAGGVFGRVYMKNV